MNAYNFAVRHHGAIECNWDAILSVAFVLQKELEVLMFINHPNFGVYPQLVPSEDE
jgi:hypothetical protein